MLRSFFRKGITALLALAVALSLYVVPAGAVDGGKTNLVTYPAPDGVELNGSYTVSVRPEGGSEDEWQALTVFKAKVMSNGVRDAAMVYFDADGPVEVRVVCNGGIDNIENGLNSETAVYPKSYGIDLNYTEGDNVITFTAEPGQRIVLDPNGDTVHNIQIWIDEIMTLPTPEDLEAEGKSVSVVDASAGDQIQLSYDTDVVYVKPGFYTTADYRDITVRSDQTWYFEGGAVINATLNMDYTTNAKLIGHVLVYRPQYAAITVNDVTNAYVCGTMALNYSWANNGGYGVNIANAKNVTIKNAKSIGNGKWGDCMDIFCSEDVTVEGCFFRGNDDCIAIYGPRWNGNYWGDTGNVRNIKVENCVLMPDLARPIHFGTHGDSSSPNGGRVIDNCRFQDIDILTYNKYAWRTENGEMKRMPQPIRMDVSEGNTITNIYFDDIRIQDYMANELVQLFITTQDRYGTYTYPGKGINNIYFKDVDYTNPDDTFTGRIEGYDTSDGVEGMTQNVTFENLKINGELALSAEDAHINIGSNTKNINFVASGESKYVYNPSIVPEDIWPEYYDYTQIEGASASADISENGSDPSAVLDTDVNTVWYSQVGQGEPVYYDSTTDRPGELEGDGLIIDLGAQRQIKCVRITWDRADIMHDYRIFISKDGQDWSAGHTDEHGEGAVNSRNRPDYNKRVKSNWLANQHDPKNPDKPQDNIVGRYVKIIPRDGYRLDISKVEILGDEQP